MPARPGIALTAAYALARSSPWWSAMMPGINSTSMAHETPASDEPSSVSGHTWPTHSSTMPAVVVAQAPQNAVGRPIRATNPDPNAPSTSMPTPKAEPWAAASTPEMPSSSRSSPSTMPTLRPATRTQNDIASVIVSRSQMPSRSRTGSDRTGTGRSGPGHSEPRGRDVRPDGGLRRRTCTAQGLCEPGGVDDRPLRVAVPGVAGRVRRRADLARQAGALGEATRILAKLVQGLKRPTLAMWAVVAAADDAEPVRDLVELDRGARSCPGQRRPRRHGERHGTAPCDVGRRGARRRRALAPWEPSAEARRAEIRTIVDQLSRHGELLDAWIDGTLRELPETDAFGFAAFTGMEAPAPRKEPVTARPAPSAFGAGPAPRGRRRCS